MLTLFSPAKINLFLRILGKRPDGYHELSSLFQTISLGDTLHFQLHESDELTCQDPTIPTDQTNLIWKAINLFRRHTGTHFKIKVHLDKCIPIQAGLGGGSSNAATALWACNQLTGGQIPANTLSQWGAEIGSDISFFFSQGTAYCTGRGEIVRSLPALPNTYLWIVKPPIGLSTPEIYKRFQLDPHQNKENKQSDLDQFLCEKSLYVNDLEKPAFEVQPELKILKDNLLQSGFDRVLMTGSGSAFFCLGEGRPPVDTFAFRSQFINRNPALWYSE